MINKYEFSNYTYDDFLDSFKENLIEKKIFNEGFYNYSVFNINNSTVTLMKTGINSKKDLIIGVNEKDINETIKLIKSKGFNLEEIIK